MSETDRRRSRRRTEPDLHAEVTPLGIVRFLSEIVLWGGIARLVIEALPDQHVLVRYLAAIAVLAVVLVGWSRWLAPKGARRIIGTPRLVIEMVLMAIVAGLLALRDHTWWAAVLVVTFSLGQLAAVQRERRESQG